MSRFDYISYELKTKNSCERG